MTLSVRLPYQTEDVETLIKRLETYGEVSVELLDGQIKLSGATEDLQNAQNFCLRFIGPEAVFVQNVSPTCFSLLNSPSFLRHFEKFFKIIIHPKSYCVISIKGSQENIDFMHPYLTTLDQYSMASDSILDDEQVICLKNLCDQFQISFEELPEDSRLKLPLLSYLSLIVGQSCVNTKCKEPVSYIEAYRRRPVAARSAVESPIPEHSSTDMDHLINSCICTDVTSSTPRRLRKIVIDGSNVAFAHGRQNHFSSKGIVLAINYFLKRGHTSVVAVIPRFRRRNSTAQFDKLERSGHLAYTPARVVNNTQQVADDDRFILRLALETNAVIVSNDQFRNYREESTEFKDLVDKRLLQYTLALDTFLVADDPLGRDGPSLSEFLSYTEPGL